jgi:hypothetical protein
MPCTAARRAALPPARPRRHRSRSRGHLAAGRRGGGFVMQRSLSARDPQPRAASGAARGPAPQGMKSLATRSSISPAWSVSRGDWRTTKARPSGARVNTPFGSQRLLPIRALGGLQHAVPRRSQSACRHDDKSRRPPHCKLPHCGGPRATLCAPHCARRTLEHRQPECAVQGEAHCLNLPQFVDVTPAALAQQRHQRAVALL